MSSSRPILGSAEVEQEEIVVCYVAGFVLCRSKKF